MKWDASHIWDALVQIGNETMSGWKVLLMAAVLSGILSVTLSFASDETIFGQTIGSASQGGSLEGTSPAAAPIPQLNSGGMNQPIEAPAVRNDSDSASTVLAVPSLYGNQERQINDAASLGAAPSGVTESMLQLPSRNLDVSVSDDFDWRHEARSENNLITPPGSRIDGITNQGREAGEQSSHWLHARVLSEGPTTDATSSEDSQWSTLPIDSSAPPIATSISSTPSAPSVVDDHSSTNLLMDATEGFQRPESVRPLQDRTSLSQSERFPDGFGRFPEGLQLPKRPIEPAADLSTANTDAQAFHNDEATAGMITQTFSAPTAESRNDISSAERSVDPMTSENTESSRLEAWDSGSVFTAGGDFQSSGPEEIARDGFQNVPKQQSSTATNQGRDLRSFNSNQSESFHSVGVARALPESTSLPPRDTTATFETTQIGGNGYQAAGMSQPKSLLTGILLVSLISNIYLIFWLKRLRLQFRDLLATKRLANHSS